MSYEDGWAAMNLEMPARVPHYEPSVADYHWDLVRIVTGMDVNVDSPSELRLKASQAFVRAWNFDLNFGCSVGADVLMKKITNMGHAEYAQDGRDFDNDLYSAFDNPEEALAFDPWETYGEADHAELVQRFNRHYREQCQLFPTAVNTTGIYTTLMSGMIFIFGWDMLLTMAGLAPDRLGELFNRYASWIAQYYNAIAESDAPILYCHDDIVWTEGAFMRPDWYRKYVFPNIKKLWAPAGGAGKKIIFICDGDYTQFADDIAACGNHGFWFEIFTDLEYMTQRFGNTHVLVGNGDCRPLTFGTKADVRAEVERCMAAGKDCPGFFMCISGHIPPNVPVENALYYYDVYNELGRR